MTTSYFRSRIAPAPPRMSFRAKFPIVFLYTFICLDKMFVWICFPLVALFALDSRVFATPVYRALTRPGPLMKLTWALLISTIAGLGGLVYGVMTGSDLVRALEVLVFNISPWFLFLGMNTGMERPNAARSYIRFLAWLTAVQTPIYYLLMRHFRLGDAEEGGFLVPSSGALVLLGLFCFEKNLRRYWFPILICSFNTIASEIRADWVALGIALAIWAAATRQLVRVATIAAIMILLLAIGFITDAKMPGLPGRGGEISARDTVGRALSGIAPDIAREYSRESGTYAGTVQWREVWWKEIRAAVFAQPSTTIFGLGYGYPINYFRTYLRNSDIRSPHSVFYFTLAYGGLLGVCLFAWLVATLLGVLWTVYKETGSIFGFTGLIFLLVNSLFGNFFEAPQRAIPTFILLGMCIGPILTRQRNERPAPLWRGSRKAAIPSYGTPAASTLASSFKKERVLSDSFADF